MSEETKPAPTMTYEDSRLRLLPEIYLHSLPANGIGVSKCKEALDFLRQNGAFTEEDKTNFLQRISYCLMTFDKGGIPCNKLPHSQISIMKSFFKTSTSDKTSKEERKVDMHSLANEYCCILTNGDVSEYSKSLSVRDLKCSHPYEALDIIEKMYNGEITMEEVLQHPFHWSDQQKVLFICKAVDYINAKHKDLYKKSAITERNILQNYGLDFQPDVLSENGWIDRLQLSDDEVKIKRRKNKSLKVEKKLIYELALKPKDSKKKREMMVYELLRFFRNRYSHFYEDPKDVRICFGSYPSGYLEFFSSRFPKLVMHVYNNMKMHLCKKGEFANESLNLALFNVNMYVQ